MSIDQLGELPLYVQLANILRDRIRSGEWPPPTKLPSEWELHRQYGVSRETVRHALRVLKDEGLVMSLTTRGTFVRPQGISPD